MYLSGRLGESGFGPGDLGEDVRRAGSPEKGFGLVPLPTPVASAWLGLAAVPLLGSLIAEPAAMTIAALMLAPQIFRAQVPVPLKYLALGVPFVNISIGARSHPTRRHGC